MVVATRCHLHRNDLDYPTQARGAANSNGSQTRRLRAAGSLQVLHPCWPLRRWPDQHKYRNGTCVVISINIFLPRKISTETKPESSLKISTIILALLARFSVSDIEIKQIQKKELKMKFERKWVFFSWVGRSVDIGFPNSFHRINFVIFHYLSSSVLSSHRVLSPCHVLSSSSVVIDNFIIYVNMSLIRSQGAWRVPFEAG